jgi:hypothetical protein
MKFRGTLGSDLSGKLGGIVASHNTYGSYFRRLVKPVNPKTAAQNAQRAAFSVVSEAWKALTTLQRATWNAQTYSHKSRKGDTVTLTGQAYYIHLNTIRQRIGLSLISAPPSAGVAVTVSTPGTIVAHAANGTVVLGNWTVGDLWNGTGGGLGVFVAPPQQPGQRYQKNTYTYAGTVTVPAAANQTFTAPFSLLTSGLTMNIKLTGSAPDGRNCVAKFLSVTTTA